VLQWGHGDGAVEEKAKADVMDSIGMLQWGHGDGAVEELGCMASIPMKPKASMGPRRWSRGRVLASYSSPNYTMLQWGHGDGAVEEHSIDLIIAGIEPASMGPRRWSRGRAGGRSRISNP